MQSERREPDANENPYSRARLNSENTKLRAEITRLTEALRLQMEAKHKEAAEAKLWFQKAQEWKEALRAAEEREKALPDYIDLFRIIRRAGRSNQAKAQAVDACLRAIAGAKP